MLASVFLLVILLSKRGINVLIHLLRRFLSPKMLSLMRPICFFSSKDRPWEENTIQDYSGFDVEVAFLVIMID